MAEGHAEDVVPVVVNDEGTEVVNNAPRARRGPVVVDIRTLMTASNRPPGVIPSKGPVYKSLLQKQVIACKVKKKTDVSTDLDAAARQFNEKIKLKAQTKLKDSERVLRSKTIAVVGCIQFVTQLHVPKEASPIDLSPEEIVACLPEELQAEKIEIIIGDIRAKMNGCEVTAMSHEDQVLGGGMSSWRQPQVESMEPPVLSEGASGASVKIQTTVENGHPIVVITEMDECIVDNSRTMNSQHEISLPVGNEGGPRFGSVRVMRYEEGALASISPMALIAFLPNEAAAEINAFYDETVHSFCASERQKNIDVHAIVFGNVITPLLTELDFIIHCSPEDAMKHGQSVYRRVVENLMTFLNGAGLCCCGDLVRKHVDMKERSFLETRPKDGVRVSMMHERTTDQLRDLSLHAGTSRKHDAHTRVSVCDGDRSGGRWSSGGLIESLDFRIAYDISTMASSATRPRLIPELHV